MHALARTLSLLAPLVLDGGRDPATALPASTSTTSAGSVAGLARIAVLGASVSDGFGLDDEIGARTVFADVVDASLKTAHESVYNKASAFFFSDPAGTARDAVEAAKKKDPTLVVGIDYLFWFGYGRVPAESDRLARFEKGLASLESFTCPVLVGDLPDMSPALEGESPLTHRPMLRREQVPTPESLKKLNERLAAWSTEHANVVVVPLAEMLARVRAHDEIALRGNVWPKDAAPRLLQKDLLHPTLEGAIAVWLVAGDCLVRARPAYPADAFEWDAKAIWRKVYDSKADAREARLEKLRKAKEAKQHEKPSPQPEPDPAKKGEGHG
jgi:hypothetical protein